MRRISSIALLAFFFASPAIAEQGRLRERLTPEVMAVVYPGAERLGIHHHHAIAGRAFQLYV